MKSAKEIYASELEYRDGEGWFSVCIDYTPMLKEFAEIIVEVDDDDYQGDSRVLYRDGQRYGYLQFGWGSCSGCDALQACSTIEQVQELMDELYQSIKWFDGKSEALKWFKEHDWEGDYSWHAYEQAEFVKKCIEHFERGEQ